MKKKLERSQKEIFEGQTSEAKKGDPKNIADGQQKGEPHR